MTANPRGGSAVAVGRRVLGGLPGRGRGGGVGGGVSRGVDDVLQRVAVSLFWPGGNSRFVGFGHGRPLPRLGCLHGCVDRSIAHRERSARDRRCAQGPGPDQHRRRAAEHRNARSSGGRATVRRRRSRARHRDAAVRSPPVRRARGRVVRRLQRLSRRRVAPGWRRVVVRLRRPRRHSADARAPRRDSSACLDIDVRRRLGCGRPVDARLVGAEPHRGRVRRARRLAGLAGVHLSPPPAPEGVVMLAIVIGEGVVLLLLGLLVAGLLRSHAEILRALHDLGASVEPGDRRRRTAGTPSAAAVTTADSTAYDLVGLDLDGATATVSIVGAKNDTLLAFLSTGCSTCEPFWDAFRSQAGLPSDARLVVVVQDEESEARLRALAGPRLEVIASSAAWESYGVPGSPHFVYVDGATGRVTGEGTGPDWPSVRALLTQAADDREARAGAQTSDVEWHDNVTRIDSELLHAGIAAGHPSLAAPPDDDLGP